MTYPLCITTSATTLTGTAKYTRFIALRNQSVTALEVYMTNSNAVTGETIIGGVYDVATGNSLGQFSVTVSYSNGHRSIIIPITTGSFTVTGGVDYWVGIYTTSGFMSFSAINSSGVFVAQSLTLTFPPTLPTLVGSAQGFWVAIKA
jgi:hypothetical protein